MPTPKNVYLSFMKHTFFLLSLFIAMQSSFNSANAQAKGAQLNHIALYVVDLKKSTAFYHDIIGLDTIPEPFHDGRHTWFSIGVKSHLHLIQGATAPAEHPKNSHLCFTVPSIDAFIRNLNRYAVEYESWAGDKRTVTTRVDGVKQIYFKDPDGYWVEINDAKE
jgi:lactoylglutathione lyase